MSMQELTLEEVNYVSGGSVTGAYMALGGLGLAIVGAVVAVTPVGAAIGGVIALGGAAIGALAYAYDHYYGAGEKIYPQPKKLR